MKVSTSTVLNSVGALALLLTLSGTAQAARIANTTQADPDARGLALTPSEPVCRAKDDPAFALRKSVAVLNIEVSQPSQASDMPGLGGAVSRYLQQGLRRDENIRSHDGSDYQFGDSQVNLLGHNDAQTSSQLAELSRELDSQIIISGRISDLSQQTSPAGRDLLDRITPVDAWRGTQRHFSLELSVHDGHSGSEILRKQFHTQAGGRLDMHGLEPLQGAFLDTEYGRAVGTLLNAAAEELGGALSCIPFMSRISYIEEDSLRIEEGNDALLRPGDRLRVFHRRYLGVDDIGRERFQEEYISDAQVSRVYPGSALLKMDQSARLIDLRPGDLVRAW